MQTMAAALMALVEAPAKSQKSLAGYSEAVPHKPKDTEATVWSNTNELATPEAMQRLVDVVAKLSDVDKVIEQARDQVPDDGEARKWHLLSLTTLEWTRRAHSEQVQDLLEKLKASVTAPGSPAVQQMCPLLPRACKAELGRTSLCTTEPSHSPPGILMPQADAPLVTQPKIGCLRIDLEKLRGHDPDCCFIVRRIKHLGLESSSILEEHFGRAGRVEAVYVSHCFEKPCQKRRNGRVRPAALGFVVMATKEGAERVLAAGSEQLVGQIWISVKIFEPFADDLEE